MKTLILSILLCGTAMAAPPPGTNMNSLEAKWFQGARTPECLTCCDIADGRRVLSQPDTKSPLGYDVMLNGVWVPVPAGTLATRCSDALDERHGYEEKPLGPYPQHPAGSAVVWIYQGKIRCFSPPKEMY